MGCLNNVKKNQGFGTNVETCISKPDMPAKPIVILHISQSSNPNIWNAGQYNLKADDCQTSLCRNTTGTNK